MPKIIVLGSINIDIFSRVSHFPEVGETVKGSDFQYGLGGKGTNQAIGAKRLKGDVTLLGKVGNDAFGVQLQQSVSKGLGLLFRCLCLMR